MVEKNRRSFLAGSASLAAAGTLGMLGFRPTKAKAEESKLPDNYPPERRVEDRRIHELTGGIFSLLGSIEENIISQHDLKVVGEDIFRVSRELGEASKNYYGLYGFDTHPTVMATRAMHDMESELVDASDEHRRAVGKRYVEGWKQDPGISERLRTVNARYFHGIICGYTGYCGDNF